MKEKILSITIGALIGAVVVSSGFLISAKMNRKIGSLNGMPPMGQEQMQGLNGSMGQNGGPSNNGSQSGPMGQNGGPSNNGSQSGPMGQNGGPSNNGSQSGPMGQNGGPSNNGSQSGPMGQNGGPSNNGSQSEPMNQNGGTPPQMPNGGNTKNS